MKKTDLKTLGEMASTVVIAVLLVLIIAWGALSAV